MARNSQGLALRILSDIWGGKIIHAWGTSNTPNEESAVLCGEGNLDPRQTKVVQIAHAVGFWACHYKTISWMGSQLGIVLGDSKIRMA